MQRDERPRRRAGAVAVLVAVLVAAGAVAGPAGAEVAPPGTVPTPAPAGAPAVSDNPFIPENANLSDCISSLPGPNCGSKARGGWRQMVVFAVIVAALTVIGVRIVLAVRRRDRERNHPTTPHSSPAP